MTMEAADVTDMDEIENMTGTKIAESAKSGDELRTASSTIVEAIATNGPDTTSTTAEKADAAAADTADMVATGDTRTAIESLMCPDISRTTTTTTRTTKTSCFHSRTGS